MTNQANPNVLCDKLSYKFRNRGINRMTNNTGNSAPRSAAAGSYNNVKTNRNTSRNTAANSGSIAFDGKYGVAYARGSKVRSYSEHFNAKAYERRHGIGKEKKVKVKKPALGERLFEGIVSFFSRDEEAKNERYVKSTPIPKGFVAALVLCTVLLMVVLNTYSAYSEISAEVSDLKNQQAVLLAERDKAANLLSVRDDIREIEAYATEKIGMVTSDYVETRHVSIAGGERIEVIQNTEEEAPGGIFSTMLSAMGGYRERILEYID